MPSSLRRPGPRARRMLGAAGLGVALTAGASAAGVATSAAWPTTVATRQYAATLRLTTSPDRASTVHSPTVFGDLDVSFSGLVPAPGIDASVQVKDSIASVLASSGVDLAKLQPTSDELDAAMRDAALRIGGKVALGIALVSAAAWLVVRRDRRLRWAPPVAGVVAASLVGGSMALTYRPASFVAVRTSGLLSLVRANSGLLGDVQKRSAEATPYVRNMLALTTALQRKYTPSQIDSGSLRIIAVSDIHGANQYPLLKNLVESEGAHAVIDTGDLVNFGSVREADAAGLFRGIESLGVPYLFVRGNHDAKGPTDDALVQRLRSIKNVIVLEPQREQTYTLASVGGLTIAGFGDPRWFGDGGLHTDEAQKPAIAAFQRAAAALRDGTATTTFDGDSAQPFDLVLAHEPIAAQSVAGLARLRLNGHLHSQSLEGSRIALGSFSGGGVVSHYIEARDGSELAGQPYSFDVLSFSSSCHLSSLSRYQFSDLLEGRPTYDTVQVLNGATIEQGAPADGRTCSTLEPTQTWTFRAPEAPPVTDTVSPAPTPSLPSGSPTPTTTETRTPSSARSTTPSS